MDINFTFSTLLEQSYLSHVSIIGDARAISFGSGLFLVVSSSSKTQLVMNNDISGEPSCFDCELVHDDSFFDAKVGGFLEFNYALFVKKILKVLGVWGELWVSVVEEDQVLLKAKITGKLNWRFLSYTTRVILCFENKNITISLTGIRKKRT
ncbi:hypothetical protein M9H77_02400 [Catharanthus roseus]|uniref:Uncharacterized protein n=1 Tax=Catharanthus roseus TaxID=4058 RepID=A0ACC0C879_CATRO|nr:hypothetical protein M9H77_02400 [Catharanthus roseus]